MNKEDNLMKHFHTFKYGVFVSGIFFLFIMKENVFSAKCPCDLYKDGGTPCVAAHSTVRALYETYDGKLYQIKRKSDNKTLDISVLAPGGFANATAVDSFLKGTTGTVSIIYDQSEKKNDLTVSLWGSAAKYALKEAPANRVKDTIAGHIVYPLATDPGEGYRRNNTTGVAKGTQSEGMYMVCSGIRYNNGCCWDYGNAESDAEAGGKPTGAMEAMYFGSNCWFKPCNGNGPWVFADLEWGLFQAAANGTTHTSLPYKYVSAFQKGDVKTFTIRANDATKDVLKLHGTSNRPSAWVTNILTGAIILGIGGDSSPAGKGMFFEGAMTIGRPTDAAEDSVQKNISNVYSGRIVVNNQTQSRPAPQPVKLHYTSGDAGIAMYFSLQEAQRINISIIDSRGKHIGSVVDGVKSAGNHLAVWNARNIPAGMYLWKMTADGKNRESGKIVISKN